MPPSTLLIAFLLILTVPSATALHPTTCLLASALARAAQAAERESDAVADAPLGFGRAAGRRERIARADFAAAHGDEVRDIESRRRTEHAFAKPQKL